MPARSRTAFVRRRLHRLLQCGSLLCILAVMSLGAARAAAQEAPSEYQSLIAQGLHEFESGNFAEAKAFFQRAHQLHPSARTLRGLGMVSYELRHYVEAVDYFKQALASHERPLTTEMQREIAELLRQSLSFVTRLKLSVQVQDAQSAQDANDALVLVDTRPAYRDSDGAILLDPGAHELSVEAPGHEAVTRTIRSDGAEALSLSIRLREAQVLKASSQTPASRDTGSEPSRDASAVKGGGSLGPYVLMGGSAALAVAGGVLLTIALNNKYAVENPDKSAPDGPRYADYQTKADSVLPLSAAGIGALCAGGVGVAAGLIWKLTGGGTTAEDEPGLRLSLAGTTLLLHSRFP